MKINQRNDGEIIEIKKDINDVTATKIDVLTEKAKSYSLRCKMEMDDLFSTEKCFEKKDDVKSHVFSYKSEGKNKTIEFHDYCNHLEKHGFQWKDSIVSYEVKLLSDKKNSIKHLNIITTGKF